MDGFQESLASEVRFISFEHFDKLSSRPLSLHFEKNAWFRIFYVKLDNQLIYNQFKNILYLFII